MKAVFIALASTTMLLIAASATLGGLVDGSRYFPHHFALGLVTTFFTCLSHCIVFAYFMATHKMITLAVQDASLDTAWPIDAQRYKRRAFRMVIIGVVMALLAAFSGAWCTINPARATVHLILAIASTLGQIISFAKEYAIISANARLMDQVFDSHSRAKGVAMPGPASAKGATDEVCNVQ